MANFYYSNMTKLINSLTNEEKTETETINFYKQNIKYSLNKKIITLEQYFELINNLN